jgi:hypothetical protein
VRRLNGLGFCGMTLALLARQRVPQVVLLTEQTDPAQNGVYEVVLGYARPTLVRVGAPDRKVVAVELGAGLAVGSTVDPHGFSPVERVVDQSTTDGMAAMMRAAFAMPWAVAR